MLANAPFQHQSNIQIYHPHENRRGMAKLGLYLFAPGLFFAFLLTLTNMLGGFVEEDLWVQSAMLFLLVLLPVGAIAIGYASFDILYREHLTISDQGITFRHSLNDACATWDDVLRFDWDEGMDTPTWGLLVVRAGLSPAEKASELNDRFYVIPLALFENIPINRTERNIDMAQFRYMPLGQVIYAHKPHLFDGVTDLAHPSQIMHTH
jgi:hypothetical protein